MKQTTITIGIPTYEASESVYSTLQSIYSQTAQDAVKEIIVYVDGKKMPQTLQERIKHPKLTIITGTCRRGQSARINDIVKIGKSPLIVLTNDDVIWQPNTLAQLLACHTKTKAGLVTGHVVPAPAKTFVEHILIAGSNLSRDIFRQWNRGENYLSCNGRLLMLTRQFAQTLSIPTTLWNNDAYIYFRAKQEKTGITHAPQAICYFRNPDSIKEYLKQSQKFIYSYEENRHFFQSDLDQMYHMPAPVIMEHTLRHLLKNPVFITLYFLLHTATKIYGTFTSKKQKTPFWETDLSTKRII